MHTIRGSIFGENHIILRNSNHENERIKTLEERRPIVTLGSLSTCVQDDKLVAIQNKLDALDTCGHLASTQDVRVLGNIVWRTDSLNIIKEKSSRVVQLEICFLFDGILNVLLRPKVLEGLAVLRGKSLDNTIFNILQQFLL